MKYRNTVYAATLALALAPTISSAAVITFVTPTGSTSGGQPISASAVFTTSAGQISVTLTNTESASAIISASQEISDIIFTLSNAPGTQGTLTAPSNFGDVAAGGAVTLQTSDSFNGNTSALRWFGMGPPSPNGTGFFLVSGSTITMEAIGGGKPSQMILPAGTSFPSANSSVTGHNSHLIGPSTFTLAFSGITSDTTVTGLQFSFGTGPDFTTVVLPPIPENVPEPATLGLLGLGLAALSLSRKLIR